MSKYTKFLIAEITYTGFLILLAYNGYGKTAFILALLSIPVERYIWKKAGEK